MKKLLVIILLTTFFVSPAHAQDKTACDPAKVIASANALKSTGDSAKDVVTLQEFVASARDEIINCKGLRFEGSKDKINVVDIPAGLYLVRADGTYTFKAERIEGECGQGNTGDLIFILPLRPPVIQGAMVINVGDGCKATVQASFGRGNWSITFEPLTP